MGDVLIELFSEEIPARMQARAREDLRKMMTQALVDAGLSYASAGAFSTPRRLCLTIEGLSPHSPTTREERKGPRTDAPQAALEGFLRSSGLRMDQLQKRDDKKGQVWFGVIEHPGRPAQDIIAQALEATIRNFPWPKSMRWGSGNLRWVRPLHAILCLLSDETGLSSVVPVTIEGISASHITQGHRFLAPEPFSVTNFEDYVAKLRRARVILDSQEREADIAQQAENLAFARGWQIVPDAALLSEVAGLVEWPVALMGVIEDQFLILPPEVLQTSMRAHQKFFSAQNPTTGRIEGFVTVANIETPDDGATILAGNQRVLAARLADAAFFWQNDLRVAQAGMVAWSEGLAHVTFQTTLGTQAARVSRMAALAGMIAPHVGADPAQASLAAQVAKLDLRSAMVGEFPELQGVMGRYYALAAGHTGAIADAARDHYAPLGPSDTVPTAPVSVAVALADKIDILTGFWAIDEKPTGSKDPFALRRAALGVIRLILENHVNVGLAAWLQAGFQGHLGREDSVKAPDLGRDLMSFIHDRLKVYLRDQNIRHDVIDAVLAQPAHDDLVQVAARAQALQQMLSSSDGPNLIQGLKRAGNLLAQAEARDGVEYSFGPDVKFAETDIERALFTALDEVQPKIKTAIEQQDFPMAMAAIAGLRAPIDAFFETVQVNAESAVLRRNRLNLLHKIRDIGAKIADFTKIDG